MNVEIITGAVIMFELLTKFDKTREKERDLHFQYKIVSIIAGIFRVVVNNVISKE